MITLLVVTTGQTDVQLVRDGFRRELSKKVCGALHDELERRMGEWRIVDTPSAKATDEVDKLPDQPFQICTPKLDAVLDYLRTSNALLDCALILDTRRRLPGDPRFAGAILEMRLREQLVLKIRRAAFLENTESLEDRSNPRDAVIRRKVVTRIAEVVSQALREFAPDRILIATTGGIPVIATLVEEVVQLHAGRQVRVDSVEVADGATANPPTPDRAVPRRSIPEPAESFRARRHALDLIERGNLVAAWGAVRHLDGDELERRWTQVMEWLYDFAASLPIPAECDIQVLMGKMAVRAAIRVEFALIAEDTPRAVHGTVACFESALWDHLSACVVKRHPTRQLYQVSPAPQANQVRSSTSDDEENRKRPFEVVPESGETWYRIMDDNVCAIRLAKHYLNNANLEKLGRAIQSVRELRNDVAHNEPTPALMTSARNRMASEHLWSPEGRFLSQSLLQNVLKDLGVGVPERLCEDLIATVRSRLLMT